jgi:transcriptional regulator with XRE-family HTH domain
MSIANNIKHLRKQLGDTQEQFAQKVGIKRSLVGAYEEGRAEPRLQTLSKIAEVLDVSTDQLINLDLTKGVPVASQLSKVKVLSITVDQEDKENIELVPQKAAAGYLNGFADPEYVAELPKFKLPVLPDNATYRAFEIDGDSMLPLASGTIVIGSYVESLHQVKNGATYVLITSKEGVVYKRVFNYLEEKGKLYLVSDNKQYAPYEVDPMDVEEIWEAKAFISVQFPDPNAHEDLTIDQLKDIVMGLKEDVDQLKKAN